MLSGLPPYALLDPRGRRIASGLALAARPTREALVAGSLLLYDNTKMDVGHFGRLFSGLKAALAAGGVSRFIERRQGIRGSSSQSIAELADQLSSLGASGAVLALADMGVSPAMVALTIELERRGLPAVCLSAGPGSQLALAHAHYRAGRLCLLPFDIHPGTDATRIDQLVSQATPRLLTMLTSSGEDLQALSTVDYAVDRDPPSSDGLLRLGGNFDEAVVAGREPDPEALYEAFEGLHLGDGLPFLAPTVARVRAMAAYCPWDPDEVLMSDIGPSGTPMRIREALVAAAMAGCRPATVPVLLTALRAIARPAYGLRQAVTTSFSGGHFMLVSGPLAQALGINGGQGCLGPGVRANASLGRAINLALINVCRSVPGQADLACLSSPAEYAYCMAEDPALSPWPTLNRERLDAQTTLVMMLKAEPPHAVMDFASSSAPSLMGTILDACTTLGSNNAYLPGCLVLVLTPDHAQMLAEAGYDKARIRHEIHTQVANPLARLAGRGIVGVTVHDDGGGFQRVTRSVDDVQVVVAGGKGGHSAVILPWSLHADPIFEPICLPDGRVAREIAEFARAAVTGRGEA